MRFSTDWYSQAGQDKFVVEFFDSKRNGYFLDIGAHDGWSDSNTWYLEEKLGWKGICLEPGVQEYMQCQTLRKNSIVLPYAAWDVEDNLSFGTYDGLARSVTDRDGYAGMPVKAFPLSDILLKYKAPKVIDYISLDVENSEVQALNGFPFDKHIGILWTIEHNLYRNNGQLKKDIKEIMLSNDYVIHTENVSCKDSNGGSFEDWFVHKDYIKN